MTMHRRHTALPVRLALLSTALAVVGCHLLDISNPDVVPIDLLGGPSALGTVRAGAIGDFTLAYSGSGAGGSGARSRDRSWRAACSRTSGSTRRPSPIASRSTPDRPIPPAARWRTGSPN